MKTDVVLLLMTVEDTQSSKTGEKRREKKRWEEENNSNVYPQILANTCPEGRFRHLKIENALLLVLQRPYLRQQW